MALVVCSECESNISDTASSCPNCGYINDEVDVEFARGPIKFLIKQANEIYIWGVFLLLLFDLVSIENLFFQFHFEIEGYKLFPWALAPAFIAATVRSWIGGATYGMFVILMFMAVAGMDNILVEP